MQAMCYALSSLDATTVDSPSHDTAQVPFSQPQVANTALVLDHPEMPPTPLWSRAARKPTVVRFRHLGYFHWQRYEFLCGTC